MTHISVRNLGPGLRSIKNVAQQNVQLRPGDTRNVEVHPHHAKMLLRDANSKRPQFAIAIDDEERAAMEKECQANDWRGGNRAIPNLKPIVAQDAPPAPPPQPPKKVQGHEALQKQAVKDAAKPKPKPKVERRFITDPAPKPSLGDAAESARNAARQGVDGEQGVEAKGRKSRRRSQPRRRPKRTE